MCPPQSCTSPNIDQNIEKCEGLEPGDPCYESCQDYLDKLEDCNAAADPLNDCVNDAKNTDKNSNPHWATGQYFGAVLATVNYPRWTRKLSNKAWSRWQALRYPMVQWYMADCAASVGGSQPGNRMGVAYETYDPLAQAACDQAADIDKCFKDNAPKPKPIELIFVPRPVGGGPLRIDYAKWLPHGWSPTPSIIRLGGPVSSVGSSSSQ